MRLGTLGMRTPGKGLMRADGGQQYWQKVLRTLPIAYMPLWDASGLVVAELVGARNGAYTATVDLANTISDSGKPAPYFDGAGADGINAYSIAPVFNNQEGSASIWVRPFNAGVWTDGASRYVFFLRANATNYISINRPTSNGQLQLRYVAAGTAELVTVSGLSFVDWTHLLITWSKSNDRFRAYIDGVSVGETTVLGAWDGGALSATNTNIGCAGIAGGSGWHGWLSDFVLYNREIVP